jgi:hypothetical protein
MTAVARLGLSAASVPRPSPRIASRVVEGKALLVVIDRRKLHELNEVGTQVLALCDGARSLAAIAEALTREHEVEHERALADVTAFVEQLLAEGALELVEQGAAP